VNHDDLLKQQLEYYNARAIEYDETAAIQGDPEDETDQAVREDWHQLAETVRQMGPFDSILELASGTGAWTNLLRQIGKHVTAIDGAPEMLVINRMKLGSDPRVTYQQADLFEWQPDQTYDLVFFGFFLSHVPPDRVDPFLSAAAQAVKPGGTLCIIDEPAGGQQLSGPTGEDSRQSRTLLDGRTYTIIKEYYDPLAIKAKLEQRGFAAIKVRQSDYFFMLTATRKER